MGVGSLLLLAQAGGQILRLTPEDAERLNAESLLIGMHRSLTPDSWLLPIGRSATISFDVRVGVANVLVQYIQPGDKIVARWAVRVRSVETGQVLWSTGVPHVEGSPDLAPPPPQATSGRDRGTYVAGTFQLPKNAPIIIEVMVGAAVSRSDVVRLDQQPLVAWRPFVPGPGCDVLMPGSPQGVASPTPMLFYQLAGRMHAGIPEPAFYQIEDRLAAYVLGWCDVPHGAWSLDNVKNAVFQGDVRGARLTFGEISVKRASLATVEGLELSGPAKVIGLEGFFRLRAALVNGRLYFLVVTSFFPSGLDDADRFFNSFRLTNR